MSRIEFIGMIIRARTETAVGGNRGDDKCGEVGAQRAAFEPASNAPRGRHVMDQDVRTRQEIVERSPIPLVLQIQRNALLASIEIKKQSTPVRVGNVVRERTAPAGY